MLEHTQDVALCAINPKPSLQLEPSCEPVIAGQPSGRRVKGCVFEAALKCHAGYLLFLTNDCPYEEALHVHLLGPSGRLLDTASIFWIYCPGFFEALEIVQPDTVTFRFMGDNFWRIRIVPKPIVRIPFFSEPWGVHRPFRFSRHFVVSKKEGATAP